MAKRRAIELAKEWPFGDNLPPNFVLYKPTKPEAYDEKDIYALEAVGRLIITRKRDGWKVFVFKSNDRVEIYTDGKNEITDRFDHLRKALEQVLPDQTLLAGEAVINHNDQDHFTDVGRMLNPNSEQWREVQKTVGFIRLMFFEAIYATGRLVLDQSYEERLQFLRRISEGAAGYVIRMPILSMSFDQAKEYARKHGWEGLVLYDKGFRGSYRLDGRDPQRPKGCYKWKPLYEDDFIVRTWIRDLKNQKRLKEVVLTQIDPATRQEFYCGKLGSFNMEMRAKLRKARYPLVMQVIFEGRFPSGAVRNARFDRLRQDKKPRDCVASKSYPKAKYLKGGSGES